MCLASRFTAGKRKQYLKKRGNIFKVYKIVRLREYTFKHKYRPDCQGPYNLEFESGLNIDTPEGKHVYMDDSCNKRYPKGFHAFTTKKGAQRWLSSGHSEHKRIVACCVKSSWVHTVGLQRSKAKVVVTKKIIMPAYGKLEPSQRLITRALKMETELSKDAPGGV